MDEVVSRGARAVRARTTALSPRVRIIGSTAGRIASSEFGTGIYVHNSVGCSRGVDSGMMMVVVVMCVCGRWLRRARVRTCGWVREGVGG